MPWEWSRHSQQHNSPSKPFPSIIFPVFLFVIHPQAEEETDTQAKPRILEHQEEAHMLQQPAPAPSGPAQKRRYEPQCGMECNVSGCSKRRHGERSVFPGMCSISSRGCSGCSEGPGVDSTDMGSQGVSVSELSGSSYGQGDTAGGGQQEQGEVRSCLASSNSQELYHGAGTTEAALSKAREELHALRSRQWEVQLACSQAQRQLGMARAQQLLAEVAYKEARERLGAVQAEQGQVEAVCAQMRQEVEGAKQELIAVRRAKEGAQQEYERAKYKHQQVLRLACHSAALMKVNGRARAANARLVQEQRALEAERSKLRAEAAAQQAACEEARQELARLKEEQRDAQVETKQAEAERSLVQQQMAAMKAEHQQQMAAMAQAHNVLSKEVGQLQAARAQLMQGASIKGAPGGMQYAVAASGPGCYSMGPMAAHQPPHGIPMQQQLLFLVPTVAQH